MYNNNLISNRELIATNDAANVAGMGIWIFISLLLALVGCFVVYFVFVNKDTKPNGKFLVWLKSFLKFDFMLIEPILKICYIFGALFATLASFTLFGMGFMGFILFIPTVAGINVLIRLIYEGALMKVMIWKNTTEIKNKLK